MIYWALFAITLKGTVTLGSILVAALVGIGGLMVFVYGSKWKSAYEVAEANASAWQQTAARLDKEVGLLRTEVNGLRSRLAELEALPDLTQIHETLVEHDQLVAMSMKTHDENAEGRTQRLIAAIDRSNVREAK